MNGERLELQHKHNFSEGYKLLCRFLKEVNLYKEFLEYQKDKDIFYSKVDIDSENILRSMGNTSISLWLERHKNIFLRHNVYYTFKYWLKAFYPNFYENQQVSYKEIDLNKAMEYGVDIKNKTVKLCKI